MILVIIIAIIGLMGIIAAGVMSAYIASKTSKKTCNDARMLSIYMAVAYLVMSVLLIGLLVVSAFI